MISYLKGDLLSSPAQVQVNTVNTVGVMGKGIALQFKNKYPDMFKAYQHKCENHMFDVGNLYLWKTTDKWVLLFPTKKHWRNPSKIEYIEKGLKNFTDNYERLGIESIAFPKLGCGNGNLDWRVVKPLMEKYLKPLPITVYIYIDNYRVDVPEHNDGSFREWLHSNPKDLSFNELKDELLEVIRNNNQIIYSDGIIKHIDWQDDILMIKNGKDIVIHEDEFCEFWNYIRNSGIIEMEKIPEMYSQYAPILLQLLNKLRYLKPILISSDESKINDGYGYQCSEG